MSGDTVRPVLVTLAAFTAIMAWFPIIALSRPVQEDIRVAPTQATVVDSPAICRALHDVGNMVLPVGNNGTFGRGRILEFPAVSCFTGDTLGPGCQFPKGVDGDYLYQGALWIGAIDFRDSLVSVGADGWTGGNEMFPAAAPEGDVIYRSTSDPTKPWYEGAVSEQDYIATYTDTCRNCPGMTYDVIEHTSHRPMHIGVTQRTYAWSYSYASNFILFDYTIRNIGKRRLKEVYIGIHVDSDVDFPPDDLGGFRKILPAWYSPNDKCRFDDTVNIAWVADNDGDPGWTCPNVTGTRIVRAPTKNAEISYNWWVGGWDIKHDFGPQRKGHYRNFGTGGEGFPSGDHNKYWVLANKEIDYDQAYSLVNGLLGCDETTPALNVAGDIADGADVYYLLSVGPFDLESGQSLPLTFAYVGGLDFHKNPDNILNLPDNPDEYYRNVDFSNLGYNAMWADWVYDNPGWDTDSDGYAGKFHLCPTLDSNVARVDTLFNSDSSAIVRIDTIWSVKTEDTIWYQGDGVPDFRAASPPPRPDIRLVMSTSKIVIRFNGWQSETARDFFTHKVDFEGYRVYMARDDRWQSYSLLDTYDRENYDKFVWDTASGEDGAFVLRDDPFTMKQLRCRYAPGGCADSTWNPLNFTRSHLYQMPAYPDSIFYFTIHDFNRSQVGVNTGIRKLYPEATKPRTINKDSCLATDTTNEGYFKYYDYEYTIDNLLPTVLYYISVTTFDFGAQALGMPPMESPRTQTPIITYAQESSDSAVANKLKVGIYPNPYRIDAHYAADGYEGDLRGERGRLADRNRRIHFYNLPARCTIKIFTLDGDLVRQIDHDFDSSDPLSNHDTWDLIGRNTQLAVSGLYYWTIESPDAQVQIGKLVLIM